MQLTSLRVFMDVTDMIEYNFSLLNENSLDASFFHLDRTDPTVGFPYDASCIAGSTFPVDTQQAPSKLRDSTDLLWRLRLGSHLAQHIRHLLVEEKGFTSTVGISTTKLVSKLVGNLNKPRGQTTLIPPYSPDWDSESNVQNFIDDHDIGKLPGIGFKTSQMIRSHVLGRYARHDTGLVYGGTKEDVKVRDVRLHDGMGPKLLHEILNGPGLPKDLPDIIWGLLHGVDDSEVAISRAYPLQISIEDSYMRLDDLAEVRNEMKLLSRSLLKRMRLDLTSSTENEVHEVNWTKERLSYSNVSSPNTLQWVALPRTIRLSTRPRPPIKLDGTYPRTFTRVSKSESMPTYVFNLSSDLDALSERLVVETLMPLFRKLHPDNSGWNLSLVNICASNVTMAAGDDRDSAGRDISWMFKRQDEVLKDWKIQDIDNGMSNIQKDNAKLLTTTQVADKEKSHAGPIATFSQGSKDMPILTQKSDPFSWDSEGEDANMGEVCEICGAVMPSFAMTAHDRFHDLLH